MALNGERRGKKEEKVRNCKRREGRREGRGVGFEGLGWRSKEREEGGLW